MAKINKRSSEPWIPLERPWFLPAGSMEIPKLWRLGVPPPRFYNSTFIYNNIRHTEYGTLPKPQYFMLPQGIHSTHIALILNIRFRN